MGDGPHFRWIEPYARIRKDIDARRGRITRFVVQLEYDMCPDPMKESDWWQVARFDHDPLDKCGHDIREERLHMDVYRDGHKEYVARHFPEVELEYAPKYCENYLLEHADWLLSRFEDWHGISDRWK